MKMRWPALVHRVIGLTATAGSASDAIKIASLDKMSSVIVDKSGRRDLFFVQNGQAEHRWFYNELDTVVEPKPAAALKVPVSKVPGRPTWLSTMAAQGEAIFTRAFERR
jgi:hypothetical protein